MNIFSRFLTQWSTDDDFALFITYWDRLEYLVVHVYREKMSPAEAEAEFAQVWPWLRANYGRWAAALQPFWQATRAGGAQTATDPFQLLIEIESPGALEGRWDLMQHLPAAREAINQYLRAQ
jgi:hypothetical protein